MIVNQVRDSELPFAKIPDLFGIRDRQKCRVKRGRSKGADKSFVREEQYAKLVLRIKEASSEWISETFHIAKYE